MPNLRGVLSLLASRLPPAACDRIALAISAALLAAMMFRLRRCRSFTRASYSLVLAVTLLVSYHAYLHDFSLLLLPCFLLADYLAQCRWTMRDAGLAGLLVGFYVIPVAPTSMRTTAAQLFAAVLRWPRSCGWLREKDAEKLRPRFLRCRKPQANFRWGKDCRGYLPSGKDVSPADRLPRIRKGRLLAVGAPKEWPKGRACTAQLKVRSGNK